MSKIVITTIALLFTVSSYAATLILDGKEVPIVGDVTIIVNTVPDNCQNTAISNVVPLGGKLTLDAPRGRVYALPFTPTTVNGVIKLRTVGDFSHKLVTISECPGDFRLSYDNVLFAHDSNDMDISYSEVGLEVGKKYYLNVRNGVTSNVGYDTCPEGLNCSFTVEVVE